MRTKKITLGLKRLSFLTLLVVAVLSLQNCKKTETTPTATTTTTTTTSTTGPMTATVDGKAWAATWLINGTTSNYTFGLYMNNSLTVYGFHYNYNGTTFSDWSYIWLSIPNVTATGTFNLGAAGTSGTAYYWVGTSTTLTTYTWYATNTTNTGTATISKLDVTAKKMSGTFSFKAQQTTNGTGNWGTGTVNVTNGSFSDIKF